METGTGVGVAFQGDLLDFSEFPSPESFDSDSVLGEVELAFEEAGVDVEAEVPDAGCSTFCTALGCHTGFSFACQ